MNHTNSQSAKKQAEYYHSNSNKKIDQWDDISKFHKLLEKKEMLDEANIKKRKIEMQKNFLEEQM